jgi:predicted aminopeptidase
MPDWKKQNLYEAIAELESEIDKARTRLAAILDVVGKAIEGSEKIMDALRKVVAIIQDAKTTEKEKAKLAAPAEKQIESQKRNELTLPKKNSFDKSLDDEIPGIS